MGTRSLTHVVDEKGATLVTIYSQFDGYPSGMGADLAEFLRGRAIVNGIGADTPEKASNGMGCLAASLVASLKDGIGGIYLEEPGSEDHWEEYVYTILPADSPWGKDSPIQRRGSTILRVQAARGGFDGIPVTLTTLYEGPPEAFDAKTIEAKEEAMA